MTTMETVIMTVGTSILTNRDFNLEEKRPWVGQKTIGDRSAALEWLSKKFNEDGDCLERLSAETNTLWQLDPEKDDKIILLYSDTSEGLECAEVVQDFFKSVLNQENVTIARIQK